MYIHNDVVQNVDQNRARELCVRVVSLLVDRWTDILTRSIHLHRLQLMHARDIDQDMFEVYNAS